MIFHAPIGKRLTETHFLYYNNIGSNLFFAMERMQEKGNPAGIRRHEILQKTEKERRKDMKKKLLCILLTLCMCIGLLPMTAVADTQEGGTGNEITEVTVGIGAVPTAGNGLDTVTPAISTTGVTAGTVTWYKVVDGNDMESTDDLFIAGKVYKAKVTLTPDTGYIWGETVTVTILGQNNGVTYELADADSTGARVLTITFPTVQGTTLPGGNIAIDTVTLTITAPNAGEFPIKDSPNVTLNDGDVSPGIAITVSEITWYTGITADNPSAEGTEFVGNAFAANTVYAAKVTLTLNEGYDWGSNVTVSITENQQPYAADAVQLADADSTGARVLTVVFPATGAGSLFQITKVTLSGITAPVTGAAPKKDAPAVSGNTQVVTASEITWYTKTGETLTKFTGAAFTPNTVYSAKVTLTPKDTHTWSNTVTIEGLGEGVPYELAAASGTSNARELTITFPPTEAAALGGSVSISGEAKYGETLTAATSNTPADAVLKYQWCRGNDTDGYTAISDATSSTYTLTAEDIDKTIQVEVSADNYSGNIKSAATAVVQRVDPTKDDFSFTPLIYLTYDGTEDFYSQIAGTVTKTNDNVGNMTVSVWNSAGQKITDSTAKDADQYTVKVSTAATGTHNAATDLVIGVVTVAKATATNANFTFTAPNPALTYNGTNQMETIRDGVELDSDYSGMDFEVYVSNADGDPNLTQDATSAITYDVYVRVLDTSTNFKATAKGENGIKLGSVTINKATLTKDNFTFTAPNPALTYTGENQIDAIKGAVDYKTGLNGTGSITAAVYTKTGTTETKVTEAINAGDYYIKVTAEAGQGYAALTDAIEFGPVTIGKATPTASFAKATVKVAKDGTVSNALTITPSSLTATYSSSKADVAEVDSTSGEVTLKAEGTTTITATIAGNDNYNGTTATYELTVLPEGTAIYTININAGTGGTVSTAGGEYISTETVSVTATPNTGYKFVKWTAAESGSATATDVSTNAAYTFTPDKNLNLTAHFEVISGGSGSGNGSGSSSSGGGSSASSKTETSTNNDGSTTTTTTDKNGTVTEKTEHTDGTVTTVETKKDGTVTEKTENTDGTVTTVETKTDGTVTEKTESTDGSVVTVETKTDGTTTTTEENADGSRKETTAQANGAVSIHKTDADGTEVRTTITETGRTTATVSLPENTESKTVTIPTNTTPSAGTVVVVVNEDGTREVVKTSVADGNGVAANLPDGATVEVVDLAKAFNDVNTGDWFKNAIDFVSARELMNGVSSTTFDFDAPLTRGMLAQILHNLEGNPAHNGEKDFHDIGNAWYTDAVRWAAENGIVSGYADGSYGPNDPITREQLATILYRYAQMKGYDVSSGEDTDIDHFSDANNASAYALTALQWAYGDSIVSGNTDGTLNPTGEAERAQVAQMLMNFLVNTAMK